MKKKFLMVVLLIFMILSACSNSSQTNAGNKSEDTKDNGKQVTLTYALWDKGFQVAFDDAIKTFESTHPNIKVETQLTPVQQYWTKMDTATTGGSLTDLFWMNGPNSYKYISNDILMPITDKVNEEIGNYPKSLVAPYEYKNNLYAVPFEFATVGLWYNKKLFKEANVPFPDASWDWNKLRETAKKLTNSSKGIWGIAAANSDFTNYYDTIVQNGGYIISDDKKKSGYDDPNSIGGLKLWTDLIKDGSSPTLAQMTETDPQKMFESGKVAMAYFGTWVVGQFASNPYMKENADVAPLPKGKNPNVAGIIHGTAVAINKNTKHPKEAVEFLKFLTSKQANEIFAKDGAFIPAYNGMQAGWVASVPEFKLQTMVDSIPNSIPYPISKDTNKWNDVANQYFMKAWSGEMSIEDAAKTVAQKMNDILAKE